MVCIRSEHDKTEMNETIKDLVDHGATMIYSHGG